MMQSNKCEIRDKSCFGNSNKIPKNRICILTQPLPNIKGIDVHISNFIKMIEPLSSKLILITSNFPRDIHFKNNVLIENLSYTHKKNTITKIFMYVLVQLRMAYTLTKVQKDIDIIIFYLGGMSLVLPMIQAKILKKDIVLVVTGSGSKTAKKTYGKRIFGIGIILSYIIESLERINFHLADRIVVLSNNLVNDLGLSRYLHKIDFNCAISVDTSNFIMKHDVNQRENKIGYIGRISVEKGILNFAKSIPLIPKKYDQNDQKVNVL